jgi:hypothetical protein
MNGTESDGLMAEMWSSAPPAAVSTLGRMSYLSSLRDPVSGLYRQVGLASRIGEAAADGLLRAAHRKAFQTWLCLNLSEQNDDLDLFLSATGAGRGSLLAEWSRSAPYREFLPAGLEEGERLLYLCDLEALTQLLYRQNGVEVPPDPWRAAGGARGIGPRRELGR